MRITRIQLKNWLNFQKLDTGALGDRVFIIGPNAAGKSNLLESLRFLRDVALPAGKKPQGGGLQNAVTTDTRGGLSKLRCLNAKKDTEVRLQIDLTSDDGTEWTYDLGFKGEGQANNRINPAGSALRRTVSCCATAPTPRIRPILSNSRKPGWS
jgi:predicted ATPase